MANNVNITSNGIQKVLRNYNEKQALAEYIWNGFDANAKTVEINYAANELGFIDVLEISDNGHGINFENLSVKFEPFFESEKALQLPVNKNRSVMHGKNGVGRLTFFKFANDAEWQTTFLYRGSLQSGRISIGVHALNNYQSGLLDIPLNDKAGTRVIFSNLKISAEDLEREIIPYLKAEFCWFLELNKKSSYTIMINGIRMDYSDYIQDYEENLEICYEDTKTLFRLKFVQWKESLHKELSKVYFINEKDEEVHKEYTTLNKKADEYFHSVYIQSEFFTDFDFSGSEFDAQVRLYQRSKSSPEFKFLHKKVNELLRAKRKLFLKEYSSRLVERYQKEGIIAEANVDVPDSKQKKDLLDILKTFYEIHPKLFSNLSIDQKKTIVSLLDTVLVSDQRGQILPILEKIAELDDEEKAELNTILMP
ncbi:Histidine kinase-, DNA gyrase B-, and HSP90-like ATPase [Pedobacter westerhofensis]|uniref:Histidine kinase-, DNA gyrase B-, and HSP90-like ATPase n=1 Tax=Pedobacter westerhofensis TaxID=425512 RepID=A0A521FCX9_9SPHI|nr:ATP-binding protein [Pedobacter westerhofensis]SMO94042.1 Histidine kinase-, DNA gyrase B-, and HSP90-like ATPase [Pedobacter westerhofensis]